MPKLNPEQYKLIKQILIDIEDLPKDEQIKFAQQALTQHPDLIPEMMTMIQISHQQEATVFQQSPLDGLIDRKPKTIEYLAKGSTISNYEIQSVLGSGGMGVVYAAKQNYPAERMVALKLIQNIPKQQQLIAETQILAKLNHPNIATLFEIGESEEGKIFIVMELIDGEDIISWAKHKNLSEKAVLKLFQQLCAGISSAHEKGIIHCDIKPNNVLVTEIDGEAVVKVIDFGISQFEDVKLTDEEVSGTPTYLAPEILEHVDAYVSDTRRDVYAMGVLLSKLLPKTHSKDLQAIINRATADDPAVRYATPAQLSDDINRYLRKEAVSARPKNLFYLSGLFIRRRFAVVLIGVLFIATLTGAWYFQLKQAEAARLAQQEAEELSAFLTDLFNVANPEKAENQNITALALLQKAEQKLLDKAEPTLSDSRFLHTIGSIYTRLYKLAEAKTVIEHSLDIKRKFVPEDDPEIIQGLIQLGLLNKNLQLTDLAEERLLEAKKLLQQSTEPDISQSAYVHNHLGNLYFQAERYDEAIEQQQTAIVLRKQLGDPKLLADSYNNLGVIYRARNQYAETSKYMNLALMLYIQEYGEEHPFTAIVKNNLSKIEEHRLQFVVAEQLLKDAYQIFKNSYGLDHYNTLTSLTNLLTFYERRRQFDQAIEKFNEVLSEISLEQLLTSQAYDKSLNLLAWMGFIFSHNSMHQEAAELFQILNDSVANKPPQSADMTFRIYARHARSLYAAGEFEQAVELVDDAIAELQHQPLKNNAMNLYLHRIKGDWLFEQGQFQQAGLLYTKVIAGESQVALSDFEKTHAWIGLSKVKLQQGQLDKAMEAVLQADQFNDDNATFSKHNKNKILAQQGAVLFAQGERTAAQKMWQEVLFEQQKVLPANHPDLLETQNYLQRTE